MTDTPEHIHQKHLEIVFSKTLEKRFLMGLEMMEDVRQMVMNSIRLQHSEMTEKETRIEFIKRYYKNDFSKEYLEDVIHWMKQSRE